jgi:PTS system mannose-specific IIA component
MFGGTATSLALPFLEPGKIEVVTGTNLPMLVKLGSLRSLDLPLSEIATRLTRAGQKSIRMASELLQTRT